LSPTATPARTSEVLLVLSPIVTGLLTGLPSTMICTVGLVDDPWTADVGTVVTSFRDATTMAICAVMPGRRPAGNFVKVMVTGNVTVELPDEDVDAAVGNSATTPAPVRASAGNVMTAFCPALMLDSEVSGIEATTTKVVDRIVIAGDVGGSPTLTLTAVTIPEAGARS